MRCQGRPFLTLRNDLSLKPKMVVTLRFLNSKVRCGQFAQFYATCPMCAKRNSQGLKALYDKYKDNPDFVIVCITVGPRYRWGRADEVLCRGSGRG